MRHRSSGRIVSSLLNAVNIPPVKSWSGHWVWAYDIVVAFEITAPYAQTQ
jgi:hypothetical protein